MRGVRAAVACAAMVFAACAAPPAWPPDAIVLGVRTAPNTLDPRFGTDEMSQRIGDLVYGSLMVVGDDLRAAPGLAERLDRPDALTYVVTLRQGVRFHDGHLLTSKDVVYTFGAFLDPAFVSPYKGAYRMLAAVTALDDRRIEFRLKEPFAAFPIQLVTPPIVPDGAGDTLRTHPVGTGPYRFVSYAVDDRLILAPFQDYFGGAPRNGGLVIRVIPDETMRGLELRKGTLDLVVNDLAPDIVHELGARGRFAVTTADGLDYAYLGFNMRDAILRDRRVRHAIGYAIDRKAIVDYLRRGLARQAEGLVPSMAWAHEAGLFDFTHDPARARRLLDEAGYPDPDGDGPRSRLTLTLKVSTNEETRLQATVIQEDLRRVGIDLQVRSYEFATLYADVLAGNFQIFSLQWVGGALVDPDILRRVFHSTQVPPAGFNRGYYSNPDVDRAIDRASVTTDEVERRLAYGEAQRLIAEDAPYIGLWNKTNVAVAQPGVIGLRLNTVGSLLGLKDVRKPTPGKAP